MDSSPAQPAYQKIELQLRAQIASGSLTYGSQLPNIQSLAKQFRTSVFTIQTALAPLVRDGLIERTRKRGTFVRGVPHQLVSVGIYFDSDVLNNSSMAFYRELYHQLERELEQDRVRFKLWLDSRTASEQKKPLPELQQAVEKREIQSIIAGHITHATGSWLTKLGVPLAACCTNAAISSRISMDSAQMLRTALGELKRQGCKTVAIISPYAMSGDDAATAVAFYKHFVDAASDLGLRFRNEWMTPSPAVVPDGMLEEYGYNQFHQLWNQKHHPDGLIIYPDVTVRGAILAMLERNVSVPRQLKLVLHRNDGIPLLCPLPASWIVSSVRQSALALIEQVKRQIAGKTALPQPMPLALEASAKRGLA